jgi:hypothetical protein
MVFCEIGWRVALAGFLPNVTSTWGFSHHQTWIGRPAKSPFAQIKGWMG